ncbi:hypothetical protein L798_11711 [Zootermopsis nevadensis]|uniref:Uncharacterized protein n=1 Tax=Zootermopsis nevadensis TaxID=136037 RepID=A0A067R821_ZOONE|nr:hypothetical protein L798_11711 [Zootermopsis nevadensis]
MGKTKDLLDDPDDTHHDKELEDLMVVESTAQACITSALHIEQSSDTNQNLESATSDQQSVKVSITNGELSAQE